MEPQGWGAYAAALGQLVRGEINCVFVTASPGCGVVTRAREFLEGAGIKSIDFRLDVVDPEVLDAKRNYLADMVEVAHHDDLVPVVSGADVMFENGVRLERLLDIVMNQPRSVMVVYNRANKADAPGVVNVDVSAPVLESE